MKRKRAGIAFARVLRENEVAVERFAFGQFLLQLQHERMREEARSDSACSSTGTCTSAARTRIGGRGGLSSCLITCSERRRAAPIRKANPGATPSLDPRKICSVRATRRDHSWAGLDFVRARAEKLLAEFDGMRIDHPQGLVCPWVYRANDTDPLLAVRDGARLYSAPDLPGHPGLRQFSLVRPDQLNPDPGCPRYGDEHVQDLLPEQIERYAVVLDAVLESAKSAGRKPDDILCEVLSTWPTPLKAVMKQRGMGRFCITQKADPHNPNDVYRPENTSTQRLDHGGEPRYKASLAGRGGAAIVRMDSRSLLAAGAPSCSRARRRHEFAARVASDQRLFCEAMFAELFLGPAQNVSVFFADLLGERRLYNQPGTVGEHNWTLRLPCDYRTLYVQRVQRGEAFDPQRALALALEALRRGSGSRCQLASPPASEYQPRPKVTHGHPCQAERADHVHHWPTVHRRAEPVQPRVTLPRATGTRSGSLYNGRLPELPGHQLSRRGLVRCA